MSLPRDVLAAIERVALGEPELDDVSSLRRYRAEGEARQAEMDAALIEAVGDWELLDELAPDPVPVAQPTGQADEPSSPAFGEAILGPLWGLVALAAIGGAAYPLGVWMSAGLGGFATSLTGIAVGGAVLLLVVRSAYSAAVALPAWRPAQMVVSLVVFSVALGVAWAAAALPGFHTEFASATLSSTPGVVEFSDKTGRLTTRVHVPGATSVQLWWPEGQRDSEPLVVTVQDAPVGEAGELNAAIQIFDARGRLLSSITRPERAVEAADRWVAAVVMLDVDGIKGQELIARWNLHEASGNQLGCVYRWDARRREATELARYTNSGVGMDLLRLRRGDHVGDGLTIVAHGLYNPLQVFSPDVYPPSAVFFRSLDELRGGAPGVPGVERSPALYVILPNIPGQDSSLNENYNVVPLPGVPGDGYEISARGRLFRFDADGKLVHTMPTDQLVGHYGPKLAEWIEREFMGGLEGQVLTIRGDDPDPDATMRSYAEEWYAACEEMDLMVQAERDRLRIYPFLDAWDRSMDFMRFKRAEGKWPWGGR